MTKTITLDCRGLACPGPVMKTLEALEKDAPEALEITVDDQAALENVSRLLGGKGYAVEVQAGPGAMRISARRAESAAAGGPAAGAKASTGQTPSTECAGGGADKVTVFITADGIGAGSDELGGKLMQNFLATLPELGPGLWRVVLVNGGVRLACEGHPCLEKLQALAAGGVAVLVCGTCLGFFGLTEQRRVGETTNMLDVVTSLGLAGKVIQV